MTEGTTADKSIMGKRVTQSKGPGSGRTRRVRERENRPTGQGVLNREVERGSTHKVGRSPSQPGQGLGLYSKCNGETGELAGGRGHDQVRAEKVHGGSCRGTERQSHGENIPVVKARSDMVCQGDRQ